MIPNGTLKGVHFVQTPDYVQVTGQGDFTKINIPAGDSGGELDNRGSDGRGNPSMWFNQFCSMLQADVKFPVGGLLFGDTFGAAQQYHEWTNFMSDKEFCIRACRGPRAAERCNHIYDEMGCYWVCTSKYFPSQVLTYFCCRICQPTMMLVFTRIVTVMMRKYIGLI